MAMASEACRSCRGVFSIGGGVMASNPCRSWRPSSVRYTPWRRMNRYGRPRTARRLIERSGHDTRIRPSSTFSRRSTRRPFDLLRRRRTIVWTRALPIMGAISRRSAWRATRRCRRGRQRIRSPFVRRRAMIRAFSSGVSGRFQRDRTRGRAGCRRACQVRRPGRGDGA